VTCSPMSSLLPVLHAASTLHTVAVKANPVGKVLQVFRDQGMGAEVSVVTAAKLCGVLHPYQATVHSSMSRDRSCNFV
jgi:diaminopimelate decarboxylase